MSKYTTYTPRELEVLEKPDHFQLRLYAPQHGWVNSAAFTAEEALKRFNNIKKMDPNHRVVPYAVRTIDNEERVAAVTPAYLSALVESNANR